MNKDETELGLFTVFYVPLSDLEIEKIGVGDAIAYVRADLAQTVRPSPTAASDKTIAAQFHKIWTSQVGTEGYDKDQWQKLRTLLGQRGIQV